MATKIQNVLEDALVHDAKHVKMYNVSNGKTERIMPSENDAKPSENVQDTFDYAGIAIPAEHRQLVEMMATAVARKIDAARTTNQDQVKAWMDYTAELEAWNKEAEAKINELRAQIKVNNARLAELKKDLAAYDATESSIQNQVLRQLVQLGIVTSEQIPQKVTKPRLGSRGTGIKKTSFSIEFDGVVDGEQSYFDSPGNLAWYKFNKCGSAKLFDVLAEQNNGIRPGSPEHEALPGKRLAAILDGHTFAFIMR